MILEGVNAVFENRKLMGATNPKDADENTIRKLLESQSIKTLYMVQIRRKCKKEIEFFLKTNP